MFYDRFKALCEDRGISCNRAAAEIGLSNATPTTWKKRGLTPKSDTLTKIADYFGVTTDYLLGAEEKKPTSTAGEQIPFADRREALASAGIHIYLDADAKLTEDQLDDILDFIEFQQRKNGR